MKRNWILAATLAMATTLTASAYEINWHTPDAGGVSDGAGYQLSGAIGQADAGTLGGGGYRLFGGFYTLNGTSAEEPCPGDTNGDDFVDLSDLSLLLGVFGTCQDELQFAPEADFDNSGCIDLADLSLLLGLFGTNCL